MPITLCIQLAHTVDSFPESADDPTFEIVGGSLSLPVKFHLFGCHGNEENLSSCSKQEYENYFYFYAVNVAVEFVTVDCNEESPSSESPSSNSNLIIALVATLFCILTVLSVIVVVYIVKQRKQKEQR